MSTPRPCAARHGAGSACELPALHPGDHAQADVRWPRSERDQAAYQRAQVELMRLRQEVTGSLRRSRVS